MVSDPRTPARGRYLAALRACGAMQGGVRFAEDLDVMEVLTELGLVEFRLRPGVTRRHTRCLTSAGRDLLAKVGTGKPRET